MPRGTSTGYATRSTLDYQPQEETPNLSKWDARDILNLYHQKQGLETFRQQPGQEEWNNEEKRAMLFRKELTHEHRADIRKTTEDFNRNLEHYQARHGENWQENGRAAVNFSQGIAESGHDLIQEGIKENDEAKLMAGRALMKESSNAYREMLENPNLAHQMNQLLEKSKWTGLNEQHYISSNQGGEKAKYMRIAEAGLHNTFMLTPEAREEAREEARAALWKNCSAKFAQEDASAARDETRHSIDNIRTANFGRRDSVETTMTLENLRDVNERIFDHSRGNSVTQYAEKKLGENWGEQYYSHNFQNDLNGQRDLMVGAQQQMLAITYALKADPENMGWDPAQETRQIMDAAESKETDRELVGFLDRLESMVAAPEGNQHLQNELRLKVLENLEDLRERVNGHSIPNQGMTAYEQKLLRETALIEQLTRPGRIKQCMQAADNRWEDFIQE